MRAGLLRKEITIQSQSRTADGMGGATLTWATFVTTWASIVPASGRERNAGGRVETNVTHKIVMRYQPGITPAMRVLYGSRVFQIQAALDEDELGRELSLFCQEGPAT